MNFTTQNAGDLALLCNLRNIRICMGKNKYFCNLSSAVCFLFPVWSPSRIMAILQVLLELVCS